MQVSYHKDHESAYQKLITDIALSQITSFHCWRQRQVYSNGFQN